MAEEIKKSTDERLLKVVPVAQAVIKIIGNHPELIGDISKEARNSEYKDIVKEIMEVFVDNDINYTDRKYVFQVALLAFDSVGDQVINSVEKIYEMANVKLFGKDILDIKMSDLEKIING